MRLRRPQVDTQEIRETWQPKLWGILVTLGAIAAYVIAFILSNRDAVPLDFVFGTAEVSLIWLILLSLALGIIAGLLLSQLYRRHYRRQQP